MLFKEKTNIKLLDLLVQLDFFFIEYKNKNIKSSRIIKKKMRINDDNKNKSFIILNPLEFLKCLKRIIRLFQFLKNNDNIKIAFDFRNDYSFQFLKFLLEKKAPKLKETLDLNMSLKVDSFDNTLKSYFFFNSLLTQSKLLNFLRTNKYLTSEFNNIINNLTELGNYKLFTNFNDPKKIVFLILLIKNIYK
jgi:hypothetical protein